MAEETIGLTARTRLTLCALAGVLTALGFIWAGKGEFAALAAWDVTAILYGASILARVSRFNAAATKSHALSENPGRAAGDVLLLLASLASLFAVGVLLVQAGSASGGQRLLDIGLGLTSVVISWSIIHITYMLVYARLYYGDHEGGISFNEAARPNYADFAYLSFTLGMTYQVSDTNISSRQIRSAVLRHTLLSYIFGTVIIAATINFLAGLSK